VDDKADKDTTYTETEVDGLLNAKADQDTTYTETEVDDLLDDKAAISGQAFSGDISAPNLSGTNTGDQTLSEIGVGQTWQDMTASRALGVNYTNTTGNPIGISIGQVANGSVSLFIDGIEVVDMDGIDGAALTLSSIVPVGAVYQVTGASVRRWLELR